jgi:hypothetical protein
LILQQFPPPYGAASLQQAAAALTLKSGFRAADTSEFESLPAPFLAVLKPATVESLENDSSDARSGLAMVLQSDATKIYCLEEKSNAPSTVAIAALCRLGPSVYTTNCAATRRRPITGGG